MDSVVHFEIPTKDMKRAQKFYDIFGWHMDDIPAMHYTLVQTGKTDKKGMLAEKGFINGGLTEKSAKITAPLVYINVKSIDETLKMIEKKGGKTLQEKTNIQGNMYSAYFTDSEGNVMGLIEGSM